jgi:hypothetical protein
MEAIFATYNILPFKLFESAFNWPINEGSSFKLEHLIKSNFCIVFNLPIDGSSFFKLEHLEISSS